MCAYLIFDLAAAGGAGGASGAILAVAGSGGAGGAGGIRFVSAVGVAHCDGGCRRCWWI